jgi:hypothetical protein
MSNSRNSIVAAVTVTAVGVLSLCAAFYWMWAPRAPATSEAAAAAATEPPKPSAELQKAQVHSCLARIDSVAQTALRGTNAWQAGATWDVKSPDAHLAGLIIGQKYDGGDLNTGVTAVLASPIPAAGQCDGVAVQVVPSTQSCEMLAHSVLAANGRTLGALVGTSFLQNRAGSQLTLVPSAGNGCVVVGLQVAYSQ